MRPELPRLTLRRAMLLIAIVAILASASIQSLRRPYPVMFMSDAGIGFIRWSDGSGAWAKYGWRSSDWGAFRLVEWGDGSHSLYLVR